MVITSNNKAGYSLFKIMPQSFRNYKHRKNNKGIKDCSKCKKSCP
jgi:hypothetical protein